MALRGVTSRGGFKRTQLSVSLYLITGAEKLEFGDVSSGSERNLERIFLLSPFGRPLRTILSTPIIGFLIDEQVVVWYC